MGMYTGLRARLTIKEEFRPVIEDLMTSRDLDYSWENVAGKYPQYEFLRDWSMVGRCDFIPFGALAYMPWDDADPEWQRSFKDGMWVFQCSLKNYQGEIQAFVEIVLPHIVEICHELYSLYEENDEVEHLQIP